MKRAIFYSLVCFYSLLNLQLSAAWTPPVTLSQDISKSPIFMNQYPGKIAVDSRGNGFAVWSFFNGSFAVIQAGTLPKNALEWQKSTLSQDGHNAFLPELAVNPQGQAIAVWARFNGTHHVIQASTFTKIDHCDKPNRSSEWMATADLSPPGVDAIIPQVAIDNEGNAIAVWIAKIGDAAIVQSATLSKGATNWTLTGNLSPVDQTSYDAQIAIDASGKAYAVWTNFFDANNIIIQGALLPKGSLTWTHTSNLSPSAQASFGPNLAVNPSGFAVTVWTQRDGSSVLVNSASLASGETLWQLAGNTVSVPGQSSFSAEVTFNPEGIAVAIWNGGVDPESIIQTANFNAQTNQWIGHQDISTNEVFASAPQISFNPNGNALAVWTALTDTHLIIQSAGFYKNGSIWKPLPNISGTDSDFFSTYPRLAFDPLGNGIAIWQDVSNSVDKIQVSNGLGFFGPTPPLQFKGIVIKNRFATQTDIIHVLSWKASQDTLTKGYRLYEGSRQVSESIASNTQTDYSLQLHGRKKHKKYTYTLVGFYPDGSESTPSIVSLP